LQATPDRSTSGSAAVATAATGPSCRLAGYVRLWQ
jgi:hypothetical protein